MISLLRRLRAWLRALPLQRRVAYLTTAAVALAVAVTSVAGYLTLRISLYRALDAEMVQTATSLAVVPVVDDIGTGDVEAEFCQYSIAGFENACLHQIRFDSLDKSGALERLPGRIADLCINRAATRRRLVWREVV